MIIAKNKMIEEALPKLTRHHYGSVDSTQLKAREFIEDLKPQHWHLITADAQTAGKGTHGRSWFSPDYDNIYATFMFTLPKNTLPLLANIPQVVAYSIILTLENFGLKPKLKWVNDVLINRKKISGILCQSESAGHSAEHFAAHSIGQSATHSTGKTAGHTSEHLKDQIIVLTGIGINVNMTQDSCLLINQPITSMRLETNQKIDREQVLQILQDNLISNIVLLYKSGFNVFAKIISEKLEYIGETIYLQEDTSKKVTMGVVVGINPEGYLLLNTGKTIETFLTGHILSEKEIAGYDAVYEPSRSL